jgi:ABC-type sulfate transport system permease component
VVLPTLTPAVVWLLCHGFAAGITALGTVVVFAEPLALPLGAVHMLISASTGGVGAACAVATVLLALAGGATLLGRAAAGRESIPTLLA